MLVHLICIKLYQFKLVHQTRPAKLEISPTLIDAVRQTVSVQLLWIINEMMSVVLALTLNINIEWIVWKLQPFSSIVSKL